MVVSNKLPQTSTPTHTLSAKGLVLLPEFSTIHTGAGRVDTPQVLGSLQLVTHGVEHADQSLDTAHEMVAQGSPLHGATTSGLDWLEQCASLTTDFSVPSLDTHCTARAM